MGSKPREPFDAEKFLLKGGDAYVKDYVDEFNELKLPLEKNEAEQCKRIRDIMIDYSKRKDPPRPLSIGMFGPPGSGKGFTIQQLAAAAKGYEEKPATINLSQLDGPGQLAESLLRALSSRGTKTPLILFDEFDATLDGNDLGWLKWFLAPMQDAVFFHNGQACKIHKAVFFFAGGTAERFDDFQARHEAYFIKRKGPDFVSRLRGTMDIEGVNTPDSDDRILRRALVLQYQLKQRAKQLCNDDGTLKLDPDVVCKLLDGGHYIHGARSMEALLDMCQLTKKGMFKEKHLPHQDLIRLHVSRDSLDGRTIGISAGLFVSTPDSLVDKLARKLMGGGTRLAYGGTLGKTLESILDVAEGLVTPLISTEDDGYRIWNPQAYPGYERPGARNGRVGKIKEFVKFHEMRTLSNKEMQELELPTDYFKAVPDDPQEYNPKQHLAWAMSLFRMRVRFVQEISALVVVGGKGGHKPEVKFDPKGVNETAAEEKEIPWGRFAGVAEEVMLAIAFGKPVYVVGMSTANPSSNTSGQANISGQTQVSPTTTASPSVRQSSTPVYACSS